jgi:MFS family permease
MTLIATILGATVVFLDSTVVNVALPSISDNLDAGLAGQQWVVEAYMLTMVSLLLVGGSLGDQFGRRRMFVAGLVTFGATSAFCAVSPSVEFLVGARALQGIAGALLVPGSLAIVAGTFVGAERGNAVGTWTAWTGIATVLGPAGGGALIGLLSWRAIFWVNLPLIAATVVLTLRAVEESRDPGAFHGIDWVGIGLSVAGLGGPVFALIEQPTHGWSDPLVWVPLVGGIACFALFLLLRGAGAAPDARPRPVQDPQLQRRQPDHPGDLRRVDRRPLLRLPLPAAGWPATRRWGRGWRRPRSRCCSSSSRRALAASLPASGRARR